jgi:hypothetical protein
MSAIARQDPWKLEITRERAGQIRVWRVDELCSWRGVASAATVAWATHEETSQMLGVELCRAAADLLGEDHRKEPWN